MLDRVLEETCTLEDLEQKMSEFSWSFGTADQDLIEALKRRVNQGKKIKSQFESFLQDKTKFALADLTEISKSAKEAGFERLKIAEIEQHRKILNDFLIFFKVLSVLFNIEPVTLENIEKGEFLSLEDKQIDEILLEANHLVEETTEFDRVDLDKLHPICANLKSEDFYTNDLRNFFEKLLVILRKEEAKTLLKTEDKKASKDIESFVTKIPNLIEMNEEDRMYFKKIQVEGEKIFEWKNAHKNFMDLNPKDKLTDALEQGARSNVDIEALKGELEQINQQVQRLQDWFTRELSIYSDLKEQNDLLNNVHNSANWIVKALDMKAQVINNNKPLNYTEIKTIYEELKKTDLQQEIGLSQVITDWFRKADEVRNKFINEYQRKRIKVRVVDIEQFKVQQLIDKNAEKSNLTQGNEILQTLRSVGTIVFLTQEIDTVNLDIQACKLWSFQVKETLRNYEDVFGLNDMEEEGKKTSLTEIQDEVIKRLNEMKTQMGELALRDEEAETNLVIFEWECEAVFALNGLGKENGYDSWKKLINTGEKIMRERKVIKPLIEKLKTELTEADRIKGFFDRIKKLQEQIQNGNKELLEMKENNKKKFSFEEVEEIMQAFEFCKVSLKEEKVEMSRLFTRVKNTQERAMDIIQPKEGQKASLTDFTSLQDRIKKLPVNLYQEYLQLDNVIVEANKLEAMSKKILGHEFQELEDLIKKYKECPVYISWIAKQEKTYEESKAGYERVKRNEPLILDLQNDDLSYEVLVDLGIEIDNLEKTKMDPSLKKLKKYLFIKKCNILRKQSCEDSKPSVIISYSGFLALVLEGESLRKQYLDDSQIATCIHFIENLKEKAGEKLREIKEERNIDRLNGMSIAFGFIDFNQEIIERKASLTIVDVERQNLQFFDITAKPQPVEKKADKERKRGRPKKGEEKTPKKEKSNEKDRKSREKSRDREKNERKGSDVKNNSAPKPGEFLKNLSHQKAGGTKSTDPLINSIIEILMEKGDYLKLGYTDCFNYAKKMTEYYPTITMSKNKASEFKENLRTILKYPNAAASLAKRHFEKESLNYLLRKDAFELKRLEARYTKKVENFEDDDVMIKRKGQVNHQPKRHVQTSATTLKDLFNKGSFEDKKEKNEISSYKKPEKFSKPVKEAPARNEPLEGTLSKIYKSLGSNSSKHEPSPPKTYDPYSAFGVGEDSMGYNDLPDTNAYKNTSETKYKPTTYNTEKPERQDRSHITSAPRGSVLRVSYYY